MKTLEERRLEIAIEEGKARMKNHKTRNRGVASAIRYARRELRNLRAKNRKPKKDWREHDAQGIY